MRGMGERLDLVAVRAELENAEDAQGLYHLGRQLIDTLAGIYAEEDKYKRAQMLASLRGPSFWLDDEEVERMVAYLDAGGKLEHERGMCRRCRGDGSVVGRSHCFGHDTETCHTCDGRRIDNHRVKVPSEGVTCKCPEGWFFDEEVIEREQRPLDVRAAMKHTENCPFRVISFRTV